MRPCVDGIAQDADEWVQQIRSREQMVIQAGSMRLGSGVEDQPELAGLVRVPDRKVR